MFTDEAGIRRRPGAEGGHQVMNEIVWAMFDAACLWRGTGGYAYRVFRTMVLRTHKPSYPYNVGMEKGGGDTASCIAVPWSVREQILASLQCRDGARRAFTDQTGNAGIKREARRGRGGAYSFVACLSL